MHILFITHYFAPDSGAAAVRLTRLAKMLHARGHDITVLTTLPHYPQGIVPDAYRGRFSITEDRDGLRVIQVWLWTSPSGKIRARLLSQLSFMLTCALRGIFIKRPDVIFIENQPIFTGLTGWFISRIKRRPYLLNVSDYWPEYLVVAGVTTETSLTYRVFRALANRTQRSAAQIVVMWQGLVEGITKRLGTPPPIDLIYNAVDLELFHPDTDDSAFREKYNLGTQRIISFLGVLGPHIDVDTMLAVAAHFQHVEDVCFLFVGAGSQKDKLTAALEQPEYSHCRWIDWIDHSEVPSLWAASYLTYWAMHDNEVDKLRFQAKLYEALGSGTPSVIAVAGLMSDILAESGGGLTVAPDDSAGLIVAIERLLTDVEYHAEMSRNARAYAEAHYHPDTTTDAYEQLLQSINATR